MILSQRRESPETEQSVVKRYKAQELSSKGTVRVGFWLTPEVNKAIELEKIQSETSKSMVVEAALREHFKLGNMV